MRAAVITAPGAAGVVRATRPEPGDGAVRVRLEGCGVCGSSVPVWQGRPWFEYPMTPGAPGHEGWGIVDETGDGVTAVRAGDRVALLSQHAFAEYDIAAEDALVVLPSTLDALPFPGEALGCAYNVFRSSGIQAGDMVAVVGVGFIGAVVTALAAGAGARVIGISRRAYALDMARTMGAHDSVAWRDGAEAIRRVLDLTAGRGCDVVVEAVGAQAALDLATDAARECGRIVIAGYHQDGTRSVDMQKWNWRALDIVNAHEREPAVFLAGMSAAARAVADGTLDVRPLLTHPFALSGLGDAMRSLHERPDGFMKALVLL